MNIFNLLRVAPAYEMRPRVFPNPYFINPDHFEQLKRFGYLALPQVVPGKLLQQLKNCFHQLQQIKSYQVDEHFVNSGRFHSTEIRTLVMNEIGRFSKSFLPSIFNPEYYDENTTGAFQIKPVSKNSALNPHQDSPVIDELHSNGIFVWIPLQDITEKNGPVWVLPGSHLWGNHQRSLNVPWPFEKNSKFLWKYMLPITLKAGDMLCWDTALIHASPPNVSSTTRVAVTTTVLPKQFKMVDYFVDEKTPENKIEKYEVTRSFWESEDIMKRPPIPPNKMIELEDRKIKTFVSKKEIRYLASHFKP